MRAAALAPTTRSLGRLSSLDFSAAFGTGFNCPGRGRGLGTSTYWTAGFGSASRLAALKAGLSRIGISGTCTRVAHAPTANASTEADAIQRERFISALPG